MPRVVAILLLFARLWTRFCFLAGCGCDLDVRDKNRNLIFWKGIEMYLETDRLIIRSIQYGDEKAYAEMAKDGSLSEIGFDESFSDWSEGWINEAVGLTEKDDPRANYIPCTIMLKSTGEVIGNVGCTYYEDTDKIGICYFAGAKYRRNGYVSEAAKAYASYFFEHYEENEIIATIKANNVYSWKTAERAGFRLVETRMYKDIDDEKEELYRFYSLKRG